MILDVRGDRDTKAELLEFTVAKCSVNHLKRQIEKLLIATQLTTEEPIEIQEPDFADKCIVDAAYSMIDYINEAKRVIDKLADSEFIDNFNSNFPTIGCIQKVGIEGFLLDIKKSADYVSNAVIDLTNCNSISANYELSELSQPR
jgi:hypothetical protein